MPATRVVVNIPGEDAYNVRIGAGVLDALGSSMRGVRECLNYGHTLAHAIEKLSGYGTYSHGHAVAEGMRFAARMGMRFADMPVELAQAQGQLLDDLGLPELGWEASPAQVLDVMKRDKKARRGQVRFVCLRDVGQWQLQDVTDDVILEELEAYFAQKRR